MHRIRPMLRASSLVAAIGVLLLISVAPALGHTVVTVGKFSLAIGWLREPAYVDGQNAVQVVVKDAKGKPVSDLPPDALKVVISVGTENSASLPLVPSFDADTGLGIPGDYEAPVIPTVPGNYTFHVTGTINGTAVDQTVTSSDQTFAPVVGASDLQFPNKEPALDEIVNRLQRQDSRIAQLEGAPASAQPGQVTDAPAPGSAAANAAKALDEADRALTLGVGLAVAAAIVALIALLVALRAVRRAPARRP